MRLDLTVFFFLRTYKNLTLSICKFYESSVLLNYKSLFILFSYSFINSLPIKHSLLHLPMIKWSDFVLSNGPRKN